MAAAPDSKPSHELVEKNLINPDEIEFVPETEESEPVLVESAPKDDTKVQILARREDARGLLAMTFTVATFLLFILGFLLTLATDGDKVENFKEIFLTISGIFSGLLGFVVGYYFRRGEN